MACREVECNPKYLEVAVAGTFAESVERETLQARKKVPWLRRMQKIPELELK
jgi:hypothetical protein